MSEAERHALRVGLQIAEIITDAEDADNEEADLLIDALNLLVSLGETEALSTIIDKRNQRIIDHQMAEEEFQNEMQQRELINQMASNIRCPQCGAAPGSNCVGPKGNPLSSRPGRHHSARTKTAEDGSSRDDPTQ